MKPPNVSPFLWGVVVDGGASLSFPGSILFCRLLKMRRQIWLSWGMEGAHLTCDPRGSGRKRSLGDVRRDLQNGPIAGYPPAGEQTSEHIDAFCSFFVGEFGVGKYDVHPAQAVRQESGWIGRVQNSRFPCLRGQLHVPPPQRDDVTRVALQLYRQRFLEAMRETTHHLVYTIPTDSDVRFSYLSSVSTI